MSVVLQGLECRDWNPGDSFPGVLLAPDAFALDYDGFGNTTKGALFISPYECATLQKFHRRWYMFATLNDKWGDGSNGLFALRVQIGSDFKSHWVSHPGCWQNLVLLQSLDWWREKFFPYYDIQSFNIS